MAARNNRPRMGFSKPEQGAAAQEERDMWERVKADMMRANGLKRQSDELEKQIIQVKAKIGVDWKSKFTLSVDPVPHIVASSRNILRFMISLISVQSFQTLSLFCLMNLLHLFVDVFETTGRSRSQTMQRWPCSSSYFILMTIHYPLTLG